MFEQTPALPKCHISNASAWKLKRALNNVGILCSMIMEENEIKRAHNISISPLD